MNDDGTLAVLPSGGPHPGGVPAEESAALRADRAAPPVPAAVIEDTFRGHGRWRKAAVAAATPRRHRRDPVRGDELPGARPGRALRRASSGGRTDDLRDGERTLSTFEMFAPGGGLDVDALEGSAPRPPPAPGRCSSCSMILQQPHRVLDVARRVARGGGGAGAAFGGGAGVAAVDMAYWCTAPRRTRGPSSPRWSRSWGGWGSCSPGARRRRSPTYGLRVGALVACAGGERERAAISAALAFSCRGTWANCNRGASWPVARHLTEPSLAAESDRERRGFRALPAAPGEGVQRRSAKHQLRTPRYDAGTSSPRVPRPGGGEGGGDARGRACSWSR